MSESEYIKQLESDRAELIHVLNLVASDPLPRFNRDMVSNLPIRDIINNVLRKMKKSDS